MGGRHPGHYFMDSDDFNDVVSRNKVCPVAVKEDNVEVSRAGGVSSYHQVSGVVLCGGRNGANQVLGDCIQYNLTSHMVSHCQDDGNNLILLPSSGPVTARHWRPERRPPWQCWIRRCSTWEGSVSPPWRRWTSAGRTPGAPGQNCR